MRVYYLLLTALVVTFAYSAVVYQGRDVRGYAQFRAAVPNYQKILTGYIFLLFLAVICGLFAFPLLVQSTSLWQIGAVMLYFYGVGQGVLEVLTRTAVIVGRQKHKRNVRTVALETFFLTSAEVRSLGAWRCLVGVLLLGSSWFIPL